VPTVSFLDLNVALSWASASPQSINSAYISKATGSIHFASDGFDADEDRPEDVEDARLYWKVPSEKDLRLGRALINRFIDERLPEHWEAVQEIFRSRGAYARFEQLLRNEHQFEAWGKFEQAATESALLAWAEEQGILVTRDQSAPES
jgi:hypothetical protein